MCFLKLQGPQLYELGNGGSVGLPDGAYAASYRAKGHPVLEEEKAA